MRDERTRIIPEQSAAYDSKSSGRIERYIQEMQGQIRTLKEALESRLNEVVHEDHCALPWMIRHASWIRTGSKLERMERHNIKDGRVKSSRVS